MDKVEQTQVVSDDDSTPRQVFDCEQELEDDLELVSLNDSSKIEGVNNRFNSQESFELQESCQSSQRFITPRALNNVYNQLVVLNSATYVQRIQITECR